MRPLYKPTAIILTLFLILSVAGACFATKGDESIANADAKVAAAKASEKAQKGSDAEESYKQAFQIYTQVAKDYAGKPEGAEALYKMAYAKVHAERQPSRDPKGAYTEITQLLNEYDRANLNLPAADAQRIQAVVAKVKNPTDEYPKGMYETLREQLDKQNSGGTLYKIIDALVRATGKNPHYSFWLAILFLTVVIKLITTPLTKAQFKAMKEMQTIAPKIKEIQEKYKGDQRAIGEKQMALYKEHNINPFASCLPILVQMPILMLLYYTIRAYEYQFAQAKFLWIGSALSHVSQVNVPFSNATVWLTARSLAEPDLILLVLYLISMYISTKMSAVDPSQAEQQKMMAVMMPLMFGFIFASFPSAFLLYWLMLNIMQTIQQYHILHKPAPLVAEGPAPDQQTGGGDEGDGGDQGGQGRVRRRRRR